MFSFFEKDEFSGEEEIHIKTAIIDLEQQRKQCHKTIWQYVAVWKKQQQQ